MKKVIMFIFLASFLNSLTANAFEVKATATKMINKGAEVDIEAKLGNTSKLKGKIKGKATIAAKVGKDYYISIAWNKFINQKDSTIVELDSSKFTSNFVSLSQYIKINQAMEVQGDLSNTVKSEDKSSNANNNAGSNSGDNTNNGAASMNAPGIGSFGNPEANKGGNNEINMPTLQTTSTECDPLLNPLEGTATMLYQDYLVKKDGNKVVKRPCYISKEVVKLQYDECELVHYFPQNESYRRHSMFITPKDGNRELQGCTIYGQALQHKFDETKCEVKEVQGEAITYAKRYIVIPETQQTIYISDCEPVKNDKIKVELTACSPDYFLFQKEAKMAYPAGRKYIMKDDKKYYIDENCTVLLDYGTPFLTEHAAWENHDPQRYSNDHYKYLYDFSMYEGGFKGDVPDTDYVHNRVDYKILNTWVEKGSQCGRFWKGHHWHYHWATFQRGDGSTFNDQYEDSECY